MVDMSYLKLYVTGSDLNSQGKEILERDLSLKPRRSILVYLKAMTPCSD